MNKSTSKTVMGLFKLCRPSPTECDKIPGTPPDKNDAIQGLNASDVLKRFSERTSMHGCNYVQTSRHNFTKIIWMVILTANIVFLVVHLYMTTQTYLKFPKNTKVSLSFSNLRFPGVTVCNVNPIRKSMLGDIGQTKLQQLLDQIDPDSYMETISNLSVSSRNKKENPRVSTKIVYHGKSITFQ